MLATIIQPARFGGVVVMRMFKSPRPGRCASCEGEVTGRPVYDRGLEYCCAGCAAGGPCICNYEADLAEDGVDHLGLLVPAGTMPFELTEVESKPEAVPAGDGVPAEAGVQ
jgi:hypothetical protein